MDRKPRVALLIDADNSPASKIDLILNELSTFGETNIRRAYGNWKKNELKGWEEVLHEHAIRPMQQFDYTKGKNASDMAMVIDALELLYTDRPDAFGIVSSDADFTPLVMHLRAKGAAVYGFGAQKTPEPFVNACSRFLFLDKLRPMASGDAPSGGRDETSEASEVDEAIAATPLRASPTQLKQDARLVQLLRNAVQAAADDEGWARVGAVGTQIANQASFDHRNYGYATLTKLLVATQLFDIADEGKSTVMVRDKRQSRPSRN
ncbi:TIGR00288 family protein [Polaromonas sp. OV174]|uniref:NYN domain-containing protein n=1 Tax=Polaromonas sp. OV174 TaxID=1855300 RepID=UPI0008EA5F5A|nr:NYN domain-containing protein [Polaromonas sp. OV174]SFB67038.1 TIGR00288 family protein [Polaromonas sp. OV174]